jgi:hypothetical protein
VPVVAPSDVTALQKRISAEWLDIETAVDAQREKLLADQLATYDTLAARVLSYNSDDASFFNAAAQVDAGEALHNDLVDYVESLKTSGLTGLPTITKTGSGPSMLSKGGILDKILDILPWVAIAVIVAEIPKGKK